MQISIRHVTRYTYSKPVFCEPHVLRLKPRDDPAQKLISFRLRVTPQPAGMTDQADLEGNSTTRVWFDGLTLSLGITTVSTVETLRSNPFDFLLDPEALRLPLVYPESIQPLVTPYLQVAATDGPVARLARDVCTVAGNETVPVLLELCKAIQAQCPTIHREEGVPWPAATTLAQRQGSCRDLAVLMNAACRSLGLASRFVSGYHAGDPDQTDRTLHAWTEVYLPGAGWRGFDASHGLAVADQHVAIAAGAEPYLATPTEGTFRGTGVISRMETQIALQTTISDGSQSGSQSAAY